jgi:hypothetical protein
MSPGADLFKRRHDGGTVARRSDGRSGADVHEIDHGDGCVRFGDRDDDGRERAGAESGSADIGRQHKSQKPSRTQGFYRLRRKSTLLVVLARRRSSRLICGVSPRFWPDV